jgi:hypothetical protein
MKKILGLMLILCSITINAQTQLPPASSVTMQLSDMYVESGWFCVAIPDSRSYSLITKEFISATSELGWAEGAMTVSSHRNSDEWLNSYGWRYGFVTNFWPNYPSSATPNITTIYHDALLSSAVTNIPGIYWNSYTLPHKLSPMAWLDGGLSTELVFNTVDQYQTNTSTFRCGGNHEVGITIDGPSVSSRMEYRITFNVLLNIYPLSSLQNYLIQSSYGILGWRSSAPVSSLNASYLSIQGDSVLKLSNTKYAVWVRPGIITKINGCWVGNPPSRFGFWSRANIAVDQARTIN